MHHFLAASCIRDTTSRDLLVVPKTPLSSMEEALISTDTFVRLREDLYGLKCNETLEASPLKRGPRPEVTLPNRLSAFADVAAEVGVLETPPVDRCN